MRRTRTVCMGLVGVLSTPTLSAQQVAAPGSRVRVVGSDRQAIAAGTFVRMAGDTVVLTNAAGTTQGLRLQPGQNIEVSLGMRRRTLQGMGIGFLAGASAGALLGAASYRRTPCNYPCIGPGVGPNSAGEMAVAGAVVLGVTGIVIGGIVGGLQQREWWDPVTLHAPGVVLVPAGSRRAALMVSTSFQ